jgi:hypothetical protein
MADSVVINGRTFKTGFRPTPEYRKLCFRKASEVITPIPRNQWKEVFPVEGPVYIYDQNGYGKCTASASVGVFMEARRRAGAPTIVLSDDHLYGRINGGSDDGSNIGDALTELMARGVCTRATIPDGQWQPRKWPVGSLIEAAKFKILEAFVVETIDEFCTGLQTGWDGVFAVEANDQFDAGTDGWIPEYTNRSLNHAVRSQPGLVRHPRKDLWGIPYVGSWGKGHAVNGAAIWPITNWNPNNDAWLIRVVTHSSNE